MDEAQTNCSICYSLKRCIVNVYGGVSAIYHLRHLVCHLEGIIHDYEVSSMKGYFARLPVTLMLQCPATSEAWWRNFCNEAGSGAETTAEVPKTRSSEARLEGAM